MNPKTKNLIQLNAAVLIWGGTAMFAKGIALPVVDIICLRSLVAAAVLLLMAEEKARDLGIQPLVKIKAYSSSGLDPAYMGLGPVPAVKKLLAATGMAQADPMILLALLREAVPVLDPDSETNLLVQAGEQDASLQLITSLRERLATPDLDPERRDRLRIALAHQEARRGRFTASTRLFDQVLADRPTELTALVGRANNNYFLSRFDAALAMVPYVDALVAELPDRGVCLEVAAGTGEHAVLAAKRLPGWTWRPFERPQCHRVW